MLMKWIICKVTDEQQKHLFAKAQEQWSELKGLQGFLGQAGGWNQKQPLEACIISLWEDEQSFQAFMKNSHDAIFHKSGQRQTYETISVDLFEKVLDIAGTFNSIMPALNQGAILRVADCVIHKDRTEHFIHAQKEIWNPGMSESKGMLAGVVGQSQTEGERYVVASIWKNEELHQKYTKEKVSMLLDQAGTKKDAINISGKVIEMIDSWYVGKIREGGRLRD